MSQEKEQRYVYYDGDLELEAYHLSGIVQKFPNHFHNFYVIGFVEGGGRHLWCRGKEYDLRKGDAVLFNPRDNHYCAPIHGEILDYRAVNINSSIMRRALREICGKEYTLRFMRNVAPQSAVSPLVSDLYTAIVSRAPKMKKQNLFVSLLKQVLLHDAVLYMEKEPSGLNRQIKTLCSYMEEHFAENIRLHELLLLTGAGKPQLLRTFTKQVGVSPYRYLQIVRIDKAKRFLEQGIAPIEVAGMAGFADQSHFTNSFKEFIGLTPKQYQRIFIDAAARKGRQISGQ